MFSKHQARIKYYQVQDEKNTEEEIKQFATAVNSTACRFQISTKRTMKYRKLPRDVREAMISETFALVKKGKNGLKRKLVELILSKRRYHSRYELEVAEFLSALGIKYVLQKRYNKLGDLSFDFYLPDHNLLIEIDGYQHFKFPNIYHDTKQEFKESQQRDRLKNNFCYDNGINLLRVAWTDINKFMKFLEDVIVQISENNTGKPIIEFASYEHNEMFLNLLDDRVIGD